MKSISKSSGDNGSQLNTGSSSMKFMPWRERKFLSNVKTTLGIILPLYPAWIDPLLTLLDFQKFFSLKRKRKFRIKIQTRIQHCCNGSPIVLIVILPRPLILRDLKTILISLVGNGGSTTAMPFPGIIKDCPLLNSASTYLKVDALTEMQQDRINQY